MKLHRLSVQNIRPHEKKEVVFHEALTIIIGKNGSGKTSIIESIYIALRGKSFKGVDDMIIRTDAEWYRIDLETEHDFRVVKYQSHPSGGKKKTFEIGGKTQYRLSTQSKYPVVLFEPDDLRVATGSPARRRLFLDSIISQLYPAYGPTLRRYDRTLLQRNKYLKSNTITHDQLFSWNVMLSRYGAEIITKRRELIDQLERDVTDVYRTIAATNDRIHVEYTYTHTGSAASLLKEYEAVYERDVMLGSTSVGPHRHNVVFYLNGKNIAEVGSRGEIRTLTLALKFLEARYIEEKTSQKPIILLDDVFSELDENRQQQLMKEFEHNQIVMTTISITKVKTKKTSDLTVIKMGE